jgi:hypothetical protein
LKTGKNKKNRGLNKKGFRKEQMRGLMDKLNVGDSIRKCEMSWINSKRTLRAFVGVGVEAMNGRR